MAEGFAQRAGFRAALLLVALTSVAVPAASGQTNASQVKADAPTFDVASVKLNRTSNDGHTHVYQHRESGQFSAINITLKALMQFAFGLPDTQIFAAPGWADSAHFDVEAKSDSAVDERIKALSADDAKLEKQRMLQALLADRFKLAVHQETRELPVYVLSAMKSGAKLHVWQGNGTAINSRRGRFNDEGVPVATLAEQLAREVGRVVVDKTGLAGRFDFTLQWTPDDSAAPQTDSSGPSIFTAVQEQLGLKLESAKAPVPVLAIDHVEMPSAN